MGPWKDTGLTHTQFHLLVSKHFIILFLKMHVSKNQWLPRIPKSISECPLLFNIPVGDFYLTYLLESNSKPDMNLIGQAFYLTLLGNLTDCKWNLPLKFSMLRVFCKTTSVLVFKKIFF